MHGLRSEAEYRISRGLSLLFPPCALRGRCPSVANNNSNSTAAAPVDVDIAAIHSTGPWSRGANRLGSGPSSPPLNLSDP